MAGPYYVDLGTTGAWNARDGLSSGACWYGLSGLQKAYDTVAAGETCYVKGTATMASSGVVGNFYSVAYDADNDTTLVDGEEVNWDTGTWTDGSSGSGIVHITSTTATSPGTVEIEMKTGTAPADNDEIKGVTSGGIITPSANGVLKGIDADAKAGTNAAGPVIFIGCDSSFAVVGGTTRAKINVNSQAVHGLSVTSAATLLLLKNIEIYSCGGSAKHGISGTSNPVIFLINCSLHNNSGAGISGNAGFCFLSTSYGNTGSGFHFGWSYFCSAYDNGSNGTASSAIGCVLHNNLIGINGFSGGQPTLALNNVIDANTSKGIAGYGTEALHGGVVIIGNRITNHSGAGDIGIDLEGELSWLGWNYLENNTGDNIQDTALRFAISGTGTATDVEDGVSVDDYGYVDSANHDFATNYDSGDPDNVRRTAITIPWT